MNDFALRKAKLFFLLVVIFQALNLSLAFAEEASVTQIDKPSSPTEVQKALTEAGHYKGTVDGIIGAKTRAAIRSFQEENGLKADGLVGPKTWEKLKAYLEEAKDMDEENELTQTPVEEAPDYNIALESTENEPLATEDDLKQKLVS